MTNRIIKRPEVSDKTGISRSQIYSLIAEGKFPKQIRLGGGRASGWVESEIDQWIDDRILERDSEVSV